MLVAFYRDMESQYAGIIFVKHIRTKCTKIEQKLLNDDELGKFANRKVNYYNAVQLAAFRSGSTHAMQHL